MTFVRVNVNSSCIKSFAVDKLMAAAAPKCQRLQSGFDWFRLGGLSVAAADGSGSGD